MNAVLFLLLGLEVLAVHRWSDVLLPALATIPICLIARFVSVGISVRAMRVGSTLRRGLIPVLTWSELRAGISVALVLSLPRFSGNDVLLGEHVRGGGVFRARTGTHVAPPCPLWRRTGRCLAPRAILFVWLTPISETRSTS